jgi:hypothetical protein
MDGITRRIRTTAAVFELPQKLGILQYVEYEPPPREWCTSDGCLYEGVLTAEGCRRGVCVRYRAFVWSKDKRRWEVKEKWRRRRDEEAGGCLRQQVADALWELAEKYDVGVWYRKVTEKVGMFRYETYIYCGPIINGIEIEYQPQCRSAEECARLILEEYKNEVERRSEPPPPPPPDPAEELLKEWPELSAFGGVEWVRKWLDLRDRLVEIAKVLRRYPWMVDAVRQRPVSILHPYVVEVYVARDGSEACISLTSSKAFCAQNGAVKEVKLELEFKRYETYEDKMREVYRPKGLLAYAAAAREYVRML